MPQISPFKLERYFAKHEFSAEILLSCSDCESLSLQEMIAMADDECRSLWDNLVLGYTESQGHPQLRDEIASGYQSVPAENILIAAPEEGIFIAMQTMLHPGDHIICITPAYQSLFEIAQSTGCQVSQIDLENDGNQWFLDLQKLRDCIKPHTRMLVFNFPHNPTGFLPEIDLIEEIIRIAREYDLIIFSDEMYRNLELNGRSPLPSLADVYEKGVALSGVSKSLSLPGLRIGWLATGVSAYLDQWIQYKDYTTICSSAPSEILALIALKNIEIITQENKEIIQTNISLASAFFKKYQEQFKWIAPQAGSIGFPEFLPYPVETFCKNLLSSQNTMLAPGHLFDLPGNYFRMGFGRRNFSEGLDRLDSFLMIGGENI